MEVFSYSSGKFSDSLLDEDLLSEESSRMKVPSLGVFFLEKIVYIFILGPLVCSFCLQEVKLCELPLVILFSILRIVFIFSPFLEDMTLPRGVTFIFTMERAIK